MCYKHVLFSMYPKQKPQQHFEFQRGCGCSLVGVGVQNVPVAYVLGTSDLAKTSDSAKQYNAKRSVEFLQLFGVNSVCITGLLLSGLRFGLGGYRVALTICSRRPRMPEHCDEATPA